MAAQQDFIDYVAEQIRLGPRISYRKMFGEYALYLDGKVVALACDNSLFIKPTRAAAEHAPTCRNGRRIRARKIIRSPTSCSTIPMRCSN